MRISDWSSDVCSSDLRGGFTTLAALRDCRPLLGIEGPAEQGLDLIGKTFLVLFAVSRHRVLLLVCVKTGRSDMNVPATPWFPSRSLQFAPRCRDLPVRDGHATTKYGRSEARRVGKEGVSTCRYGW